MTMVVRKQEQILVRIAKDGVLLDRDSKVSLRNRSIQGEQES